MNKGISTLGLLTMLLLSACTEPVRSLPEAKSYIEDKENGMSKEVAIGRYHYRFQYKPSAYILSTEMDAAADEEAVTKRKEQLDQMLWFNVVLSIADYNQSPLRYDLSSLDEYEQRQDYLLNHAIRDFKIIAGTDTLYPASYWFENNQNLAGHETIVLGFEKPDPVPGHLQLIFNDQLFRNGIIKAGFDARAINKQLTITP